MKVSERRRTGVRHARVGKPSSDGINMASRIKAARYHLLAARHLRDAETCRRAGQRKEKAEHVRLALKHLQQARAIILKVPAHPATKLARSPSAA